MPKKKQGINRFVMVKLSDHQKSYIDKLADFYGKATGKRISASMIIRAIINKQETEDVQRGSGF